MDVHTATEEAYKKGYADGYKDGYKEGKESVSNLDKAYWISIPSMLGTACWKVKCSKCNGEANYEQSFCPNCGREMIVANVVNLVNRKG